MPTNFERSLFAVIALVAAGLFASTFSADYDVPSFGGDVSTVFTPRIFLGLVFALSVLLLFMAKAPDTEAQRLSAAGITKLLAVAAVSLAVAFALPHIGFVLATAPGLFLYCYFFGYRRFTTLGLMSVLGPFAVWYLFNDLLGLPLPHTPWFSLI
ncbi:tripartite tricarboxylate transporter TctB family protein [Pelagibius litoralis]|uniref:Tripartite tricarboxylate transporter TctB family protein n=1 Tax=Pelagibius litoralis TaxID=374515 RepID=A0A967F0I2_9PROT|nr:tripartite tricarboxylate transporter TctB family protein [Pelagibius litoralis]NIA70824.1 tripartite tricarboxylate transporter TctB family protein [Pelagibius litoralis]